MDNPGKNFGRLIFRARKGAALNQRELAKACNLSFRTYQRIESGETVPRLDVALSIIRAIEGKNIDLESAFELLKCADLSAENHQEQNIAEQIRNSKIVGKSNLSSDIEIQGIKRFFSGHFKKETSAMAYWEWHPSELKYYQSAETIGICRKILISQTSELFFYSRISSEQKLKIDGNLRSLLVGSRKFFDENYNIVGGGRRHRVVLKAARLINADNKTSLFGTLELAE